jgi:hypothetical protein
MDVEAAIKRWEHAQHQVAQDYVRGLLGLPHKDYVCPECDGV